MVAALLCVGCQSEDDAAGQPTLEELIRAGRQPYLDNCSQCHGAEGKGLPGTFPALDGSRVVRGSKVKHVEIMLRGRPGTAMPAFKDQLSDDELAAIATYERNAWTFRTFEAIRPADVAAVRASLAATPP